jgi:hypothetical protein
MEDDFVMFSARWWVFLSCFLFCAIVVASIMVLVFDGFDVTCVMSACLTGHLKRKIINHIIGALKLG